MWPEPKNRKEEVIMWIFIGIWVVLSCIYVGCKAMGWIN